MRLVFTGIFLFAGIASFTYYRLAQLKKLKVFSKFTEQNSKLSLWLKQHMEDLGQRPIETLNHPEFLDLVSEDQHLYEEVVQAFPDYPDTVMPPKEFHRYLIEHAQGKYKQTH